MVTKKLSPNASSKDPKKKILSLKNKLDKHSNPDTVTRFREQNNGEGNIPENWQILSQKYLKKLGKKTTWLKCSICGNAVNEEEMPTHLRTGYCHMLKNSLDRDSVGRNLKISFVSGGLPGLGKKR